MGYSELQEWAMYFKAYPLITDVLEHQLAVLSQINASSSKKTFTKDDFMITGKKAKEKLQGKELEEYIFKMMG